MQFQFRIHRILGVLFLFVLWAQAQAQSSAGIKFGLSTKDVSPVSILVINDGIPYYNISVADTRYGIHAGIFLQVHMGHFFIQPELSFNSTKLEYKVDSLFSPGSGSALFTDAYRNLDAPFMFGFKAGALRLGVGPVGHMFISAQTGFDNYYGFHPEPEKFSYGWQGGIGFDFWKLHIDVRYETNSAQLGNFITFFGQSYDFATDNNRVIGSIGLSF